MPRKSKSPRRSRRSQRRCPSATKISQGLYLDFESFAPHKTYGMRTPMMCGYRIGSDDDIKQVVFSRLYHASAEGSGIEVCDDWAEFVASLVKQPTGRKLFAFSEHEQKLIHKATGFWFKKRYENVLSIAKHWRSRQHPEARANRNTLVEFAKLAKISVPVNYGKGQVTEKLRRVREHSGSRRRWKAAPKSVRQSWDDLLAHNSFDVSVMHSLLCAIEQDEPARVAACRPAAGDLAKETNRVCPRNQLPHVIP